MGGGVGVDASQHLIEQNDGSLNKVQLTSNLLNFKYSEIKVTIHALPHPPLLDQFLSSSDNKAF